MESKFDILTSIYFKHNYFSDRKFKGMRAEADKRSRTTLKNLSMVLKPFPGGFQILFDTYFAGRRRSRTDLLEGHSNLTFLLQLKEPSFFNYTANLSNEITQNLFHFSNKSNNTGTNKTPGKLHTGNYVTEVDILQTDTFNRPFFSKPFGLIELEIDPEFKREYLINFQAKSTFWRYLLIGDHFKDMNHPAILNEENENLFKGPTKIKLPDGRTSLAFSSKNRIELRDSFSQSFRLVKDYHDETGKFKIVKQALPFPNTNTISKITTEANNIKTDFSEIFIY